MSQHEPCRRLTAPPEVLTGWSIYLTAPLSRRRNTALAQLSESTRAYYEAKRRLYNVINGIVSAGRALHNRDPEAAAKYNSKLLYRRPSRGKAEVEATGTTATTTTTTEKK